MGPKNFPNHTDVKGRQELDLCLQKDIAWSAACSLPDKLFEDAVASLGSWTAFEKQVSQYQPLICVQEYLPVTPAPPDYPMLKEYLDFLLDMIKDLDIPHVFIHADEAVYSKLCHLLGQISCFISK